jgi:hypothetical protein
MSSFLDESQPTNLKQETSCNSLTSAAEGSSPLQTSILSMHLGSNWQPFSCSDKSGGSPGITLSLAFRALELSAKCEGKHRNNAAVYGCWGE